MEVLKLSRGLIAGPWSYCFRGYGHFGKVINHSANSVWGVKTKFEF